MFRHADSAVFVAAQRRARAVVETFLGAWRPQIWLSDRYAGQFGWAPHEQQVCLAHLIRDVQYAIEAGDTILAPSVKGVLKRACAIGRRPASLADSTLKAYQADLDRWLDRCMSLVPEGPPGRKLQQIIKKIRPHLFVFVTNRDIEATNNASERALRPCAVYRKITNAFRSEWGAVLYANTRSVVETARRRAIRACGASDSHSKKNPSKPTRSHNSLSNYYNFGRRLKILKGLTPYEFICKRWTAEPKRFTLNTLHQMPGLNT